VNLHCKERKKGIISRVCSRVIFFSSHCA
jgi:hypothetical protein